MFQFVQQLFAPLLSVVNTTTLYVLAFIEAIFFPLPPDAFLMPLVLEKPEQALWMATMTAVFSVAGAVVGYFLGLRGGRPLLLRFASGDKVERVERLYQKYDVGSIFIAGFTPIPYKVFAVAAGVFQLALPRFVVASLIGRFCRFALLAVLIRVYGESMIHFIESYFEQLTIATVLVGGGVWWLWHRARRIKRA